MVTLACPLPTGNRTFRHFSDGIPLVACRASDPLCQCWVVRRCKVTTRRAPYVRCGADAYCHPVDSYISINVGRITQ
jgi:hypothetical protein